MLRLHQHQNPSEQIFTNDVVFYVVCVVFNKECQQFQNVSERHAIDIVICREKKVKIAIIKKDSGNAIQTKSFNKILSFDFSGLLNLAHKKHRNFLLQTLENQQHMSLLNSFHLNGHTLWLPLNISTKITHARSAFGTLEKYVKCHLSLEFKLFLNFCENLY